MSYIFLQEQGEASSVDKYSDIPPSVLSKLKNTQDRCCFSDNETESCPSSPYGTTSAPLTESLGEEQLMLFAEDSPAKTSVQREREPALEESVRDYGKSMPELLERYGLSLSLRKTPRFCGVAGLTLSSETCPSWGMMQDGACWELGTSVRPTRETGCGSWPTPDANMGKRGTQPNWTRLRKSGHTAQYTINQAVRDSMWPTPIRDDAKNSGKNLNRRPGLVGMVRKIEGPSGQLNPAWVEWLMGWPVGWTDLKPLETDRFQQWRQQHGIF